MPDNDRITRDSRSGVGRIRTDGLLLPKQAEYRFPTRRSRKQRIEKKSVQRELNPHFLHGKQGGYRYNMDACLKRWRD